MLNRKRLVVIMSTEGRVVGAAGLIINICRILGEQICMYHRNLCTRCLQKCDFQNAGGPTVHQLNHQKLAPLSNGFPNIIHGGTSDFRIHVTENFKNPKFQNQAIRGF